MSLQSIYTDIFAKKGRLDPDEIEAEARDESHPLHAYLEWDDTEASRRYRVLEIQKHLRSIHIIRQINAPKLRNVEVRAFHSTGDGRRYVPIDIVMSEPATLATVREQMRRDVAELRAKYRAHELLFAEVLQEVLIPA